MSITNISKPTTALTDSTKVSGSELWSTITTTWATETRTWLKTGSLMTNIAGLTTGGPWFSGQFPWLNITPWLIGKGITNVSKPS